MLKFKGLLAAALLGAGLAGSAYAEPVTLKFHSFPPMPANSNAKFVKPWAEKVKKESNGEIDVEMYVSMQLGGKPPQLVDQVREGVVDIVWTVGGYTPGRFPHLEAFELPFMPASAEATSQAVHEYMTTVGAEDLKDYKVLAVFVHAPGKIHTKDKLIKSASDLEGLKMRGPTRVISQMLGELGATPVGMPVPQVAPSLSKGVIDGMVVPWEIMPSFKLEELTKSHSVVTGDRGLYTTPFLFLMNKAKYESLTDEQKKVIDDNSGLALAQMAGQLWDSFEAPARKLAEDAGGEFHEISGAELEQLQATGDAFVEAWIAEANEKGMDGAMLIDTARNLVTKYDN
ncbi:MAG: TRAP transporter substrate-binding protein [Roseibium album]|uniref:Neu5Ac-binding protein n=1 Tax=Roseibium album TaxID=311410 RepID=A0A0M6ZED4_9HYPH|nr:TRAP transporter substrate-binding protein [Roseibium album]MBG6147119.1 TRAP-type C4-dicarboxylate transport system substrate-binding protein [Labrenzia sp. EL_142]MBG6159794.1 TRAP-type C4-dicarboxylate transport system substrate-binding protein [Labrenzia sp. EL_162]MBG6165685.1 TRAP-type C4-dicarboxylate transport system substrate-binding protein [Labrenzia sp. EL_195]MBG6198326.1 TRAP-type C4-dicarboxylate transport system substrate-binding protein [Labrenzia sp. EL_159]MBG6201946.1 TR